MQLNDVQRQTLTRLAAGEQLSAHRDFGKTTWHYCWGHDYEHGPRPAVVQTLARRGLVQITPSKEFWFNLVELTPAGQAQAAEVVGS